MTVDELIQVLQQGKLDGKWNGDDPVYSQKGGYGFVPPVPTLRTKHLWSIHGDSRLNIGSKKYDQEWLKYPNAKKVERAVTLND